MRAMTVIIHRIVVTVHKIVSADDLVAESAAQRRVRIVYTGIDDTDGLARAGYVYPVERDGPCKSGVNKWSASIQKQLHWFVDMNAFNRRIGEKFCYVFPCGISAECIDYAYLFFGLERRWRIGAFVKHDNDRDSIRILQLREDLLVDRSSAADCSHG